MLVDVPVEQWKSYLRFHVVDGASPYLSDAFAQENFAFYNQALSGQKEMKPRWKRLPTASPSKVLAPSPSASSIPT